MQKLVRHPLIKLVHLYGEINSPLIEFVHLYDNASVL